MQHQIYDKVELECSLNTSAMRMLVLTSRFNAHLSKSACLFDLRNIMQSLWNATVMTYLNVRYLNDDLSINTLISSISVIYYSMLNGERIRRTVYTRMRKNLGISIDVYKFFSKSYCSKVQCLWKLKSKMQILNLNNKHNLFIIFN